MLVPISLASDAEPNFAVPISALTEPEARAPVAGVVLYVCAAPSITKSATIANIGVVAR